MQTLENWEDTKMRFNAWWNRSSIGRPMMRIIARRTRPLEPLEEEVPYQTPEDFHLGVTEMVKRKRNFIRAYQYMAEAFPDLDLNIGPGSLAVYLGSTPVFSWDTVWYQECVRDWRTFGPLKMDPDHYWWKRHLALIRQAVELSGGDFLVNIPDLIENVDILSAMRGPQNFCYDLMDEPQLMKDYVDQLDALYFSYYDAIYNVVKAPDGSSSYTCFQIWGPGKTAKLQCDFSALMSPKQFCRFVQPSLEKQCRALNNSLYHLDGPDAIKHLDALMEIRELDALQYVPSPATPDAGSSAWYPIYDKVRQANKSLWILLRDGTVDDWMQSVDGLIRRYGPDGLYLLFPVMEEEDAIRLLDKAEKDWK